MGDSEDKQEQILTAFHTDLETAQMFFWICKKLGLTTHESRMIVMNELIKAGRIKNVVKTKKSKKEYLAHLQEKFGNVQAYLGDSDATEDKG